MTSKVIGFIGLGLIGGSLAKRLKQVRPDLKIMAYMRTRQKLEQAQKDGVVDVILDGVGEPLRECDIIFLCAPVEHNARYLSRIRPFLKEGAIVTDVGSTKSDIHRAVKGLGMEHCFIGGHPMAGSEKTGYENATGHLLENAYYIITPTAASRRQDVDQMVGLAKLAGSIPLILDCEKHDQIVAAISQLPHIIASSLVNLVKDSDDEEERMKRLAAGGFKDITRIASSSPEMWEQICMANAKAVSQALQAYMESLQQVQKHLENQDKKAVFQLFDRSRSYRNSISDRAKGSVAPDYSFTVDIVDEPGSISTLSVILSARGINIKNIGINHNRERGEGALRITFYEEAAMKAAWNQLKKYNYELIP